MPALTSLPQTLQDQIPATPVVVFDGECVICSGFFHFLIKHDQHKRFHFAQAQSPLGTALYEALGLPTSDYETNLVIARGQIATKADAFALAMRELGGLWRGLALIRFLPDLIKTPLYRLIARNRYRWFGRYESCMIPTPELSARFLDGGL